MLRRRRFKHRKSINLEPETSVILARGVVDSSSSEEEEERLGFSYCFILITFFVVLGIFGKIHFMVSTVVRVRKKKCH